MGYNDARQPQRGQGNNDSGKTGGTSGSYQSTVKPSAEASVAAGLLAKPRTPFDERIGSVTDGRLGGYRTNPDFEPWSEDTSLNVRTGPYERAAWRLDNAETITERVLESDGLSTVQVLRLPVSQETGAAPQTLRTRMYRGQNGDRVSVELWDGGRWNALDEVELGPWTDDHSEKIVFARAENRAVSLQNMEAVRLAAQRQAVAIIS